MAYQNFYPNGYTPYPNIYQPSQPQPYQQAVPQSASPQIQNGGFVSVRSELDARNYPVAPGNSVTFKDENSPYVYTKTMGFSQLDRPIFEKYRLVKEDITEEQVTQSVQSSPAEFVTLQEYEQLRKHVSELTDRFNTMISALEPKKTEEVKEDGK